MSITNINNNIRDFYATSLYAIIMFQRRWRKIFYRRKSILFLRNRELGIKYKSIDLNTLVPSFNKNYKIGLLFF